MLTLMHFYSVSSSNILGIRQLGLSCSRNSFQFMDFEGSLPYSQEPATRPLVNHMNPILALPSHLRRGPTFLSVVENSSLELRMS
jgi:hypothetical protein